MLLRARFVALILAGLLTSSCVLSTKKPVVTPPAPPSQPPAPQACIAPLVTDVMTGQPVATAQIYISTLFQQADSKGYGYLQPLTYGATELDVYAAGYVDYKKPITIPLNAANPWSCDTPVQLVPVRGPRPTRAQVMDIKANFLSLHDCQGRLMFSWFYTTLNAADRLCWQQAWKQAGVTHVVLDFAPDYPGYWAPSADYRSNPIVVGQATSELLNAGFIPILEWTTGDAGAWTEIDQFWPSYVAMFRQQEPCVIGEGGGDPCAINAGGFEIGGPCSAWYAAVISHSFTVPQALIPNSIWGWEGCPERFSGVDNPPRADDPWGGNEDAFWSSHGGEFLQQMLYETPHGSKLLDPAGATGQFCHIAGQDPCGAWEDRWVEGLQGHGFSRPVPRSFFEVTGSDYKGGGVSDATVLRINNRALRLCQQYGVSCTFGNGIPTGPQ